MKTLHKFLGYHLLKYLMVRTGDKKNLLKGQFDYKQINYLALVNFESWICVQLAL